MAVKVNTAGSSLTAHYVPI